MFEGELVLKFSFAMIDFHVKEAGNNFGVVDAA